MLLYLMLIFTLDRIHFYIFTFLDVLVVNYTFIH